jgi:hypothetical protein
MTTLALSVSDSTQAGCLYQVSQSNRLGYSRTCARRTLVVTHLAQASRGYTSNTLPSVCPRESLYYTLPTYLLLERDGIGTS